jgi:hypothetical protein
MKIYYTIVNIKNTHNHQTIWCHILDHNLNLKSHHICTFAQRASCLEPSTKYFKIKRILKTEYINVSCLILYIRYHDIHC